MIEFILMRVMVVIGIGMWISIMALVGLVIYHIAEQ